MKDKILYNLDNSLVDQMSGPLYEAIRAAGFDVTPRNLINTLNCWDATVGEFLELLKYR